MLDRCVGLVVPPLTLSLALTPTPTRAPALPLTRRVGGRRKEQRRQHGAGRVAPGFGFGFGFGLVPGLGLGRQVVCTWLQVEDALNANKTIEHIGLFGNHDNMERPHVQRAFHSPRTHPTGHPPPRALRYETSSQLPMEEAQRTHEGPAWRAACPARPACSGLPSRPEGRAGGEGGEGGEGAPLGCP